MPGPTLSPPPPAPRRLRPVVRRRILAGALAAVLVLLVAVACGVRPDTPPPALPTPDAAETARQAAAERAEDVAGLAERAMATAGPDDVVDALSRVAAEAVMHVRTLGGVWAPPTWAVTAPPAEAPTDSPQPAEVVAALASAAEHTCADAVAVDQADLAALLASVCLAQDAVARDLAQAAGASAPGPPGVVAAADDPDVTLPAVLAEAVAEAGTSAPLGRSLDAAGFGLEVLAARTSGGTREDAATLAEAYRRQARDVLAAAGLVGTEDDPRRAAYDLAGAEGVEGAASESQVMAAAVETDVVAAWVAVVGQVAGEARARALGEAYAAARRAQDWGAPATALPGLPAVT